MFKSCLVFVTLFLMTMACGTTATIVRRNGVLMEGRIEHSTPTELAVRTPDGRMVAVPRAEVADIDHPGNGVAVGGLFLGAYGILNIAVGAKLCEQNGDAYCVGVFAPAAVGLTMLAYGLATWGRSNNAARGVGKKPPESNNLAVVPIIVKDSEQSYRGLALATEF